MRSSFERHVIVKQPKRRKVGLFGGAADTNSSSPTPSGADSPSPTDSSITRGATSTRNSTPTRSSPPRFLPPHLQEEVRGTGANLERVSLEGHTEGGAAIGMGGESEHREDIATPTRSGSAGEGGIVRSASPAKRSRADMEGEEKGQSVLGSFEKVDEGSKKTDFDEAMNGMTPAQSGEADTQTTVDESVQTSATDSMVTTNTSATNLEDEELPAYSEKPAGGQQSATTIPSLDEQERIVRQLNSEALDEGQIGHVVSSKWLARVLSRTAEGSQNPAYPKEAREGPIGPIDNSDLLPEGRVPEDPIKDANGKAYVPLKEGLAFDEDYVILSKAAYGQVVGWYGQHHGHTIVRYAHDTSPAGAKSAHIMYELQPLVLTIRKVPQPAQPKSSTEALKLRRQSSEREAVRLIVSRSEKFQHFLRRAKEAAEIPFTTKIKLWRIGKASNAPAKGNTSGVLSPPQSRSTSPNAEQPPKLVIDAATFNKMEECEPIGSKDETGNANYNGSSTVDMYELVEDATLVLEEQIGGPAGGEYASDRKPKHTIKLGVAGRLAGSQAPSAAPSRGSSPAPGGMMTRGRTRRDGRTRGTVGLSNLGNTCYMNSALQCIRSVEELAIYFLSGQYKKEINASNPLGHNGAMATKYATLLQGIYAENAGGSFSPNAFKTTLGRLQPMFSGYGQQDSQEFLSFLVDALHEDLNRIMKKPYNENPDSDDNTVHDPQAIIDLGETYRANHRARNESIAMDLFNGFYKNTMECPDCGKISITFDPYSLVTVQLPIENSFTHTYTFLSLSGKPVNHDIDFDKNGTFKALKEYIASKHDGVDANRLWPAEVYSHKIYKVFDDAMTLAEASITSADHIFFFELPAVPSNAPAPDKSQKYSNSMFSSNKKEETPEMDDPKADQFAVPVYSRQKSRVGNGFEFIMHPTYVILRREEAKSYDTVLKKALYAVSRLTSMPMLTELEDVKDVEADSSDEEKTEIGEGSGEDKEISDRSASEDGYVKISKNADAAAPETNDEAMETNGQDEKVDRPAPKGFWDPQYQLSPALRNQLFVMKYGHGNGLHCTGNDSITPVGPMVDRVKQPARRGSTNSTSSDDGASTTSTASGADANGEVDDQDAEHGFDDNPDIVIGGESEDPLTTHSPAVIERESDEELPDFVVPQKPGSGRAQKHTRGKNKGRKGRNQKGYGKKDRQQQNNQPNGNGRTTLGGKWLPKQEDDEDNPYYIKLGEGIILDWYPAPLNHIFDGDVEEGNGGRFTSNPDGKNIEFYYDEAIVTKRTNKAQRKKNGVSLDECFYETGKREVLSEDNAWYCGRCKELRRATKTLEIWTIPDILVVHLKRFGGNRSFRDKIDVLVDYPIEGLDMTERVGLKEDGKEYIYDLFAVDNHYGGLGGGHYTAFAKNFYDGQWYDYNDASCSKLGDTRLKSAAAYLLFYRRRSDKPLGPQYLQDLVNEARNPVAADNSANEETAEDSDSGEGRLGDRANGSLRSSGGWKGAGALGGAGGGLAGGVGRSQMSSLTTMSEGEAQLVRYGPEKPPQFGTQTEADTGWNWGALDGNGDVEENELAGSDAGSTGVNPDEEMLDRMPELEDADADADAADPFGDEMASNGTAEIHPTPSPPGMDSDEVNNAKLD